MTTDVITLLTNDHEKVDSLITALEGGNLTGEARADAVSTIIRELSVHAIAEEIVLYPKVRDVLDDGDELADEALAEHQRIEERLKALDKKDPDDADVLAAVSSIAAEFRHHVREEQDELFVKVKTAMSQQQLEELGDRVEKAKKTAPTHPHPKAPNSPPGNLIVGPPTALLDRLRDALTGG